MVKKLGDIFNFRLLESRNEGKNLVNLITWPPHKERKYATVVNIGSEEIKRLKMKFQQTFCQYFRISRRFSVTTHFWGFAISRNFIILHI